MMEHLWRWLYKTEVEKHEAEARDLRLAQLRVAVVEREARMLRRAEEKQ